ncbi:hypothetical protein DPMN_093602 [Dreissena polymorpha]|uniref:Resolvase HTH domain-containing protein n=1 Tax=Dreissena polymorpha TaxID=45954 RepID=A0A9D4L3U6_DREPO|nr:hypothetical protein DPMN_093602 [Dreissena polymorpha]
MADCNAEMESILNKLGLEMLSPAFKRENITPDIINKMSLYDMRCVGLYDRADIMRLRTASLPYGTSKPFLVHGVNGGVSSYNIPKDNLEVLLNIGFTIKEMSQLLGVSESTLYRRMRVFELSKVIFSDISDEDLTAIVKQTLEEFQKSGERMLIAILHQKGLRVSIHEIKRSARFSQSRSRSKITCVHNPSIGSFSIVLNILLILVSFN